MLTGDEYFFWYRQYPGKSPEFLLLITSIGLSSKGDHNWQLSARVIEEKARVNLEISPAALTDSAVYYCGVRPTVTGKTHPCTHILCNSHIVADTVD